MNFEATVNDTNMKFQCATFHNNAASVRKIKKIKPMQVAFLIIPLYKQSPIHNRNKPSLARQC